MNIESIDIVMFIRYCSTGQHIVSFCHSAHRLQKYIAMYIGPGFSHSKDYWCTTPDMDCSKTMSHSLTIDSHVHVVYRWINQCAVFCINLSILVFYVQCLISSTVCCSNEDAFTMLWWVLLAFLYLQLTNSIVKNLQTKVLLYIDCHSFWVP